MKNRKPLKILAAFLALSFFLFLPNSYYDVSAYSQPSDKFWVAPKLTTVFYVHKDFGSTSVTHMGNAIGNWNAEVYKVANRNVLQKATQTHSYTNYPNADEQSCVYRLTRSDKSLAEATTLRYKPVGASRYQVCDADILMNTAYGYANGDSGGYDVWSVFMHEAGHTIGLNHSTDKTASMYNTFAKGELRRYLSSDDKAGISAVYK